MKAEQDGDVINLQMDVEQAEFLGDIMTRIGGGAATTRRVIADDIMDVLESVGIVLAWSINGDERQRSLQGDILCTPISEG